MFSFKSVSNVNDAFLTQFQLKDAAHIGQFMWKPLHIGICFNETADQLPKEALNKDSIDSEATMRFIRNKGILMSRRRQWEYENIVKIMDSGSVSMKHYVIDQPELRLLLCG